MNTNYPSRTAIQIMLSDKGFMEKYPQIDDKYIFDVINQYLLGFTMKQSPCIRDTILEYEKIMDQKTEMFSIGFPDIGTGRMICYHRDDLFAIIDAELTEWGHGEKVQIEIEFIEMSPREMEDLPEFEGW